MQSQIRAIENRYPALRAKPVKPQAKNAEERNGNKPLKRDDSIVFPWKLVQIRSMAG